MGTQIYIRKDAYKFSSAHMTVFADGNKEALHGHNYQVELNILISEKPSKKLVTFKDLKAPLKELCDAWDEKVLIAADCKFLKMVAKDKKKTHFELCGKEYLLPSEEVLFLKTENVTCENLAKLFCEHYILGLSKETKGQLGRVTVKIEEAPNQGASFSWGPTKE